MGLISVVLFCLVSQGPVDKGETPVDAVIAAHNRERAERQLPPLKEDPRLTLAAKQHAADMAKRGIMEHEGSDHSSPADRVKQQKYPYITTGENVAKGQTSVAEVMRDWMNSPRHRENILGDYAEIGVARRFATDGTPFWCTEFGRPFPRLDPAKADSEAFERLNHARADSGCDALKLDPRLTKLARVFAAEAAAKASAPKKADPAPAPAPGAPTADEIVSERIEKSGYRFAQAAKCDATGVPSPEALISAFLANQSQRGSLLNKDFTDCGIGYALDDSGHPSWCLILARPQKPNAK